MHDPFISEGWSEKLHVITVISNPERYNSRYELYQKFERMVAAAGAILWTVELALGERQFAITSPDNPRHIRLRTGSESFYGHEIWSKESLINAAIIRMPPTCNYIAWVDADIQFTRPDWAEETIQQLQHFRVVQMFSHAQDVDPNFHPLKTHISFCYAFVHDLPLDKSKYHGGHQGHPGFAWAARRRTLEELGLLIDHSVLGSGDRHIAMGLIDCIEDSYHKDVHPVYKRICKTWQVRARHYVMRDVGYVPGLINHFWHGRKADRKYNDRWRILVDEQFNPDLDLKRDANGLWQLTERNWRLRKKIRDYFRSRNEDCIYVGP